MFRKNPGPDSDPATSITSYGFALGLSVFLLFQSFEFEATKKQSEDFEISFVTRDVPAYIFTPTLILIGLSLGVKIPPDLVARFLGSSRSSNSDGNDA